MIWSPDKMQIAEAAVARLMSLIAGSDGVVEHDTVIPFHLETRESTLERAVAGVA